MFAYNTSYHRSVKTILFEITFGLEPRTAENPNPELRRLYGSDLGTEMFQRLQMCKNLARKIASEHNDHSIEESTKYFNSKVKPVNLDDLVLMKEHNFMNKNRKIGRNIQRAI
jgi:hypothetical protein